MKSFLQFNFFNFVNGLLTLALITSCQHSHLGSDQEKLQEIKALYQRYARQFPDVTGITVEQFQQLRQQQPIVLVDVRPEPERAISIIPGAISRQEFEANLEDYRHALVVAYCTIGFRSGRYAQKLRQQGVEILNLEGSLLAWSHNHGQLTNGSGLTKKIHVYNRRWRFIAEGYEPIW